MLKKMKIFLIASLLSISINTLNILERTKEQQPRIIFKKKLIKRQRKLNKENEAEKDKSEENQNPEDLLSSDLRVQMKKSTLNFTDSLEKITKRIMMMRENLKYSKGVSNDHQNNSIFSHVEDSQEFQDNSNGDKSADRVLKFGKENIKKDLVNTLAEHTGKILENEIGKNFSHLGNENEKNVKGNNLENQIGKNNKNLEIKIDKIVNKNFDNKIEKNIKTNLKIKIEKNIQTNLKNEIGKKIDKNDLQNLKKPLRILEELDEKKILRKYLNKHDYKNSGIEKTLKNFNISDMYDIKDQDFDFVKNIQNDNKVKILL